MGPEAYGRAEADLAGRAPRYTPANSPGKGRWIVTRKQVEEIKGHFDGVANELRAEMSGLRDGLRAEMGGLRDELRAETAEVRRHAGGLADELRAETAEVRRHAGALADDLRSEIRMVADGVALANERVNQLDLRMDSLTGEVRRGFAGVRAEIHGLHEADDELLRRIEAQEQRGA